MAYAERKRNIGTLSVYTDNNGDTWRKEVNLISWNGEKSVLDVRYWNGDEYKPGVEFTELELNKFIQVVREWVKAEKERTKGA